MDISLKEIIAALALIFAYWKYIDIRKRELRWKRTEFLFKQAELLDRDEDINLATAVLDGCDALGREIFLCGLVVVDDDNRLRPLSQFSQLIELVAEIDHDDGLPIDFIRDRLIVLGRDVGHVVVAQEVPDGPGCTQAIGAVGVIHTDHVFILLLAAIPGSGELRNLFSFHAACDAAGGSGFQVYESFFHMLDRSLVFVAAELVVQVLGPVNQRCQQGFVGQAVDAVFLHRSILEFQVHVIGSGLHLIMVSLYNSTVCKFGYSVHCNAVMVSVNTHWS